MLFAFLVIAERIDQFLGDTGRTILTRLLGVILAALSVQFDRGRTPVRSG